MAENEKQTNKERLKDITDSIERGIEELFQSEKYAEYLRTMSRFHKYSVNKGRRAVPESGRRNGSDGPPAH